MLFPSIIPCQQASDQALDIYRHFQSFSQVRKDGVNLSCSCTDNSEERLRLKGISSFAGVLVSIFLVNSLATLPKGIYWGHAENGRNICLQKGVLLFPVLGALTAAVKMSLLRKTLTRGLVLFMTSKLLCSQYNIITLLHVIFCYAPKPSKHFKASQLCS